MAPYIVRWTGGATIAAKSTERFTFWSWVALPYPPPPLPDAHSTDADDPTPQQVKDYINSYVIHARDTYNKGYFNVSIAPEPDGKHAVITGLVEVKRERVSSFFWGLPVEVNGIPISRQFLNIQPKLNLTLQNDNDFAVTFSAAHVFIVGS